MTRPIYEPSDQRDVSKSKFGIGQLERRPSPPAGSPGEGQWIRIWNYSDVAIPAAPNLRNPLRTSGALWEQSSDLDGEMTVEAVTDGGFSVYRVYIWEPGIYHMQLYGTWLNNLPSGTIVRTNIESPVVQETIGFPNSWEFWRDESGNQPVFSIHDFWIVTQNDIDETVGPELNWTAPRIQHDQASSQTITQCGFQVVRLIARPPAT